MSPTTERLARRLVARYGQTGARVLTLRRWSRTQFGTRLEGVRWTLHEAVETVVLYLQTRETDDAVSRDKDTRRG